MSLMTIKAKGWVKREDDVLYGVCKAKRRSEEKVKRNKDGVGY